MIVELDRFEQEVNDLEKKLDDVASAFDVDAMHDELDQLHSEMEQPDFWNNLDRAQKVNQRIKTIEDRTTGIANLRTQCEDIRTLVQMCDEEQDESLVPEIEGELESLRKHVEEMHLATLLRGEYDCCDCILSLHAGAGGTEAQDWTQMLYRMYTRYAERHGFTVKELDFLEGDEAGVKSVTFEVKGENAYGYLKAERGVHRLVRISPFDSARSPPYFVCLSGRHAHPAGRRRIGDPSGGSAHRYLSCRRRGRTARQPYRLCCSHHAHARPA